MPGKSKRGRARHGAHYKKARPVHTVTASPQLAAEEPSVTSTHVASAGRPKPQVSVAGVKYAHVVTELRRIGILAGIMLAVLVVLVFVLS